MLEVVTILKESGVQGIGLHSESEIFKGQVVWRYDKRTTMEISVVDWNNLRESLSHTAFENIERFAYYRNGKWLLNLDDSRFMNHSRLPNVGYDKKNNLCYALRDIKKGEELTVLYGDFCEVNSDETCENCKICFLE